MCDRRAHGLFAQHGLLEQLWSDNVPKFAAITPQAVVYGMQRADHVYRPRQAVAKWYGKEERFNGTVRDECVNLHGFKTVAEAWLRLGALRQANNTICPHSSLDDLAPPTFKTAWLEAQAKSEESNSLT